ncbi:hydrogenase maturation nickel metallochaperone HypA [Desulfococcaceae bacterium HSG8]|nr:hydrogenase maturation nickel metallochaperone HypA [Desulfococcaceae bacterium HSG8]
MQKQSEAVFCTLRRCKKPLRSVFALLSGFIKMHEMGIAMQVAEIATASIPEDMQDARVERVNIKVGKLAAVVPESLRFCFEVVIKDTRLDGAELRIEEIPVVARCRECDTEWTVTGPVFRCEKCDSGSIEVLSGQELDIESIEITED